MTVPQQLQQPLPADVRQLIDAARQRVAQAVNAELTQLYWQVGRRISTELLQGQRADCGKQVMAELARQLTADFGKGWSERQLHHCVQIAEVLPDAVILHTLCAQLSWSHLRLIIQIDEPLKRDFYLEICRVERWSVRQLQERINSLLFERIAISKEPEDTIRQDIDLLRNQGQLSPDLTFRDPYVLDFLGLSDSYSERDLESAIIGEMQRFIAELGSDFAFLARQNRISIDNRDDYIDLLFYHRRLRRLVAIELKIDEFEAAHKAQMELYLRYLEKHDQMEGEASPIGLILSPAKTPSTSSCCSCLKATSAWPTTSRCRRCVRPCRPSCTLPSNWHGRNWSAIYENPSHPQPQPCLRSERHHRDQPAHQQAKAFAAKLVIVNTR
jgi:predicted nuclease of restriction endonuclease-like (RecB) superfamily